MQDWLWQAAGGYAGSCLDTAAVMNINNKQWTIACPLPQTLRQFSGVSCGDMLYLTGGVDIIRHQNLFSHVLSVTYIWKLQILGIQNVTKTLREMAKGQMYGKKIICQYHL